MLVSYLGIRLLTDSPVCKNRLILPPVCSWLWNSAPEILSNSEMSVWQFWVPTRLLRLLGATPTVS